MIERTVPLAEELPYLDEAEMNGDKYILHTISPAHVSIKDVTDCFISKVDANISAERYPIELNVRSIEVSKADYEKMRVNGQLVDSSEHSQMTLDIAAVKQLPSESPADTLDKAKRFFKDLIKENPFVADILAHTITYNLPTSEAARIIVNNTPSLAEKVIEERSTMLAKMDHAKAENIIDRAQHFISPTSVLQSVDSIPEHNTSIIRENLLIDGYSYKAEVYLSHDDTFQGNPANSDINMVVQAIVVAGSNDPLIKDAPAFIISGEDAQILSKAIFQENEGLKQEALNMCVETRPELQEELKLHTPKAEIRNSAKLGR
jgi:hypothetical protein